MLPATNRWGSGGSHSRGIRKLQVSTSCFLCKIEVYVMCFVRCVSVPWMKSQQHGNPLTMFIEHYCLRSAKKEGKKMKKGIRVGRAQGLGAPASIWPIPAVSLILFLSFQVFLLNVVTLKTLLYVGIPVRPPSWTRERLASLTGRENEGEMVATGQSVNCIFYS